MSFEIATASADDVQRIMGWARDEGWNPANTDWVAFHAVDPGAFLIGRLDDEPVVSISVTRYGAGFGFLGCLLLSWIFIRAITRPLQSMTRTAERTSCTS